MTEPNEISLVKMIGLFGLQVRDSARNLSPKVISRYCHDLAVAFNSFYETVKVLDIEDKNKYIVCLWAYFKFNGL